MSLLLLTTSALSQRQKGKFSSLHLTPEAQVSQYGETGIPGTKTAQPLEESSAGACRHICTLHSGREFHRRQLTVRGGRRVPALRAAACPSTGRRSALLEPSGPC